MESTKDNYWQEEDRAKMAAMMQEVYARVWYELAVALALRGSFRVAFAGYSARKANIYRVIEQEWQPYSHVVYHFVEERRFLCTCQGQAIRHLPCAHVGATLLFLQALARRTER